MAITAKIISIIIVILQFCFVSLLWYIYTIMRGGYYWFSLLFFLLPLISILIAIICARVGKLINIDTDTSFLIGLLFGPIIFLIYIGIFFLQKYTKNKK
jgi:hypothetical protein